MKKIMMLALLCLGFTTVFAQDFQTKEIEDKVAKASGNLTVTGNTVSVKMSKFTMFYTNRVKDDTCANYLKREQGVKNITASEYDKNIAIRVVLALFLGTSGTSSTLDTCKATGTK